MRWGEGTLHSGRRVQRFVSYRRTVSAAAAQAQSRCVIRNEIRHFPQPRGKDCKFAS